MMVTIGVYVRRWQRIVRRWAADPRVHMVLQGAAWFLAGFFGSAASLSHRLQPVALGLLLAQTGWAAVLSAVGGVCGYLLFWGSAGAQGAVWMALGLAAALLLGGRSISKKTPLLMPVVAALIVAVSGLLLLYLQL